MKKITLENGKTIEISEESYEALVEAAKTPRFEDVVKERMFSDEMKRLFTGWTSGGFACWLNDKQMQKDWQVFLHMLLWKKTYDADFVPDWSTTAQKWYVVKEYGDWGVLCSVALKMPMTVYLSTEEKARQMSEDLKRIGVIEL